MELAYVIVGGVIGLVGGFGTSWIAHRLTTNESRRAERLQAYAEWSAAVYDAAEAWKSLQIFDAIERLKASDRGRVLQDIPGSSAGKTRNELVATWLERHAQLRITAGRILLLEPDDSIASAMEDTSKVSKSARDPGEVIGIQSETEKSVRAFLRHLQDVHLGA